jgi:predicted double-glycine peptidase
VIAFAGTLLLAASLATPPEPRLTLLDVPFLSQSEALCGGAAAAMVLRYWGEIATAEEFAPLVDREAGGIATGSLERAVRDRGWTAVAAAGDAALARTELAAGRPVIALIEDRPGAFHYVVIVGWHDRAVVLHDPARTPYVLMKPAEFERRWQVSKRWMLVVAPAANARLPTPGSRTSPPGFQGSTSTQAFAGTCESRVAEGVAQAQRNDLDAAERVLAAAAYACPGAAPMRELAGVRLLQRRWREVAELAARAVDIDPGDAHAWRLLATGRYLADDRGGALDAWNRAGEPRVDLVTASGLQRTAHRVVEGRLGLAPGAVLTPGGLERAARRLDELPAAFSTRVEYVARAGGRAEVRAHVAERPVVPSGRLTWAAIGLRAAAAREVAIGVASLAGGGERVDLRWRFWPHRPAAGAALHVPVPAGLLSFEVAAEQQPFTDPEIPAARRAGARASLADWATSMLRWDVRGGIDRWTDRGASAVAGGEVRLARGRAAAAFSADAWTGSSPFAASRVRARWRSSAAQQGFVLGANGGIEWIHGPAPLDMWPGAGTGHARPALLRAHPILDDGRLRADRLGRRLAHATAEGQYWFDAGPLPLGAAIFVDAAQISRRREGGPIRDVDAGVGLRLALPGRSGVLRVDAARGLRDGRTAVSVGWSP